MKKLLKLCVIMLGMVIPMSIKTYSELIKLSSFEDRYRYLKLSGRIGEDTFGFDRYLNQIFYRSQKWKSVRDFVIIRDNGCDLGIDGYEINSQNVIIHHINPISLEDIEKRTDILLNPEYLITTTHKTHNAIHYGDKDLLVTGPIERSKNDTCPWRKF